MIGLDRAYRQVYVGDTVQDALGVKYTITERGTAAGPDGKEVEYHTLHGPELVGATEAKSAPKEAPESLRSLHAYDDPKIGPKEPRKAPVKREPKPEKKVGTPRPSAGRKNYSGLVRVGNITKAVGYNLGNGTAVLRDAGIEVVKDPATGTPCVRIQDKDAARELLASLVPPAVAVAIDAGREEITPEIRATLEDRTKTKKVPLAPILEQLGQEGKPEGPAVDYEALKEQEAEVAVRGILAQFEDEALVAELRRRGWTVSCTKSI